MWLEESLTARAVRPKVDQQVQQVLGGYGLGEVRPVGPGGGKGVVSGGEHEGDAARIQRRGDRIWDPGADMIGVQMIYAAMLAASPYREASDE